MKSFSIFIIAIALTCLGVVSSFGQSEKLSSEVENFQVNGEINFVEYYSMSGKKCAGFLEGNDGAIYCVLDNMNASQIKDKINRKTANVILTGTLVNDVKEKLIDIKDYELAGQQDK